MSAWTQQHDDVEECGCDFVQLIVDGGETFQLHHVVPDDGAEHTLEPDCPCDPEMERVDYDWIVVGHRDQDVAAADRR